MEVGEILQTNAIINDSRKAVLNIMIAQNEINEAFNLILKPYDLSSEEFNVLRILRGQKGQPANMFLIQERMISKTSNTTRLVDKLLIKSLVTRNICLKNKRKTEILITDKGLEILLKLEDKVINLEQNFANKLSEIELKQLNILLEKYRNNN